MSNLKIAKILSIIVIVVAMLVMLGWIGNIAIFESIYLNSISMKFITAFSFFLSGIMLYFITKSINNDWDSVQIVLPITTLIILLIMATLLVSIFIGVRTGIEDLFVKEAPGAIQTKFPGSPSVGSMVEFILIATTGIMMMFKPKNIKKILNYFGIVVTIIGFLAVIGYMLNISILYYFALEDISNPIALNSAILFILCGISLVLIGKETKNLK